MNRDTFFKLRTDLLNQALEINESKGVEYTQGSFDVLANFKRVALQVGISPSIVLLVYLNKHLDAIHFHVKTHDPLTEPLESRIIDAINYLILLLALESENTDIVP